MDIDNVASPEADDDFDMTADIAAAFDAAEADTPPETPEAPEGETEAQARARDEKGRFAPKAPDEAAPPEEQPKDQVVAKEPVAAPAEVQPVDAPRPPPGWSPAAKVAFASLPPEVQQSVA